MTLIGVFVGLMGLVLIYGLMALVVSWIQEMVAGVVSLRGRNLVQAIGSMLDSEKSLKELIHDVHKGTKAEEIVGKTMNHPRIKRLFPTNNRFPSYIPSKDFAEALIDTVTKTGTGEYSDRIEAFKGGINDITEEDSWSRSALECIADAAGNTVGAAKNDINALLMAAEEWFDGVMDRASGWYRRKAQWITFAIGVLLAGVMNVDSFEVFKTIESSPQIHSAIVRFSEKTVTAWENDPVLKGEVFKSMEKISEMKIPIFWEDGFKWNDLWSIPGWIITAFAISQGAVLWFTLLRKMIRASGIPILTPEQEGVPKPALVMKSSYPEGR